MSIVIIYIVPVFRVFYFYHLRLWYGLYSFPFISTAHLENIVFFLRNRDFIWIVMIAYLKHCFAWFQGTWPPTWSSFKGLQCSTGARDRVCCMNNRENKKSMLRTRRSQFLTAGQDVPLDFIPQSMKCLCDVNLECIHQISQT